MCVCVCVCVCVWFEIADVKADVLNVLNALSLIQCKRNVCEILIVILFLKFARTFNYPINSNPFNSVQIVQHSYWRSN